MRPVPSGALSSRPANAPKIADVAEPEHRDGDVDDRARLHHFEHVPEHGERDHEDRDEREGVESLAVRDTDDRHGPEEPDHRRRVVAGAAERLVELERSGAHDHRHQDRGRPGAELEHDEGHDRDGDPGQQASDEISRRAVPLNGGRGLLAFEGPGGPRAPSGPTATVASAPAGGHLRFERLVVILVDGNVAITQRAERQGVVLEQLRREVTLGPVAVLDPVAGRLPARRLPAVELVVRRGRRLLAGDHGRHLAGRRFGPMRKAHRPGSRRRASRAAAATRAAASRSSRDARLVCHGASEAWTRCRVSSVGVGFEFEVGVGPGHALRRSRPRRVPFELEVRRALAPELLGVVDGASTAARHGS